MNLMLAQHSLDLETACAVESCPHFGLSSECTEGHALIPHTARITVIGVWWPGGGQVFRDLGAFREFVESGQLLPFTGQNLKFDLKMLAMHGIRVPLELWVDDSNLGAVADYEKIPEAWLDAYAARRTEENKKHKNFTHRNAGPHSLKTQAPYHLGIEPFWEGPNHDDDQYVLKDCEYAFRLTQIQAARLTAQGTYDYYRNTLLPNAKLLLRAEVHGAAIDLDGVAQGEAEAGPKAETAKRALDEAWAPIYREHHRRLGDEIIDQYVQMASVAKAKLKDQSPERLAKVDARYDELCAAAIAKLPREMNLNSPPQLTLILKNYLGLDIKNVEGKESTEAEVLEGLAAQGRTDVRLLLDYREHQKLLSTYYPAFRAYNNNGAIHCNFTLDVARTSRTSCTDPNLQNQPEVTRKLIRARPGKKLITKDVNGIEPSLVCYYTEDKRLFDVLVSGQKFHSHNARALFDLSTPPQQIKEKHSDLYDAAKESGLSVIYGAGKVRVRGSLISRGISKSEEWCKSAVYRLRDAWPDVKRFKVALDEFAATNPITNLFGRKRRFAPDEIYMKAFNDLMQGSAGTLLLVGARRAQDEFDARGIDAQMILFVHDECVAEVPEGVVDVCDEIITRNMTNFDLPTKWGKVPLKVEGKVSDRWEK